MLCVPVDKLFIVSQTVVEFKNVDYPYYETKSIFHTIIRSFNDSSLIAALTVIAS